MDGVQLAATAVSDAASEDGSRSWTPSFGGGGSVSGGEADGTEGIAATAQQITEHDRLMHWWCRKRIGRCMQRLAKYPQAGPFMAPVPWEDLGLDDYPEVVEDPMDLQTIGGMLTRGVYEDAGGFLDPESVWEDVALCWENCLLYYDNDGDLEVVQMAKQMRDTAEALEAEFWSDLEAFEQTVNRMDTTFISVATAVDETAHAVENAAAAGGAAVDTFVRAAADWWYGKSGEPVERKATISLPLKLDRRGPVREYFEDIFNQLECGDANHDVREIETEIASGFNNFLHTIIEEREEGEDDGGALGFEGADLKRPIERLLPEEYLARKRRQSPGSRVPSSASPRGSRRSSPCASPKCLSSRDPPSHHSSQSQAWSESPSQQAPSTRGAPAAVADLIGDSSSDSELPVVASPSVKELRRMLPKRASTAASRPGASPRLDEEAPRGHGEDLH